MPHILYIDTSSSHTQIAISDENKVMATILHEQANEQAMVLNNLISKILAECNLSIPDISVIAVNAGPGSYTGLRVGLGVAKGLCFALDIPLMLFNKLELLAQQFERAEKKLLVLKARLGEGFAIVIEKREIILSPQHVFYENFDFDIYHDATFITDDETLLNRFSWTSPLPSPVLDVEKWLPLAAERLSQQSFDDLAYSEPFYLKEAFTTTSKKKI